MVTLKNGAWGLGLESVFASKCGNEILADISTHNTYHSGPFELACL